MFSIPVAAVFWLAALPSAHSALSQADANARCNSKYPGYVAVMNPAQTAFTGCVPPPMPDETVCFDLPYVDPKTAKEGCCPDAHPFSYDLVSKEGGCCPEGQKFCWNSVVEKGACCAGVDVEYTCSCTPKRILPFCPSANNQIFVTPGGRKYKIQCGQMVGGQNYKTEPGTSAADCAIKCSLLPECKASDSWSGICYHKNAAQYTGKLSPNPAIDVAYEVFDPAPLSVSDACPGLGNDGTQLRTHAGLTWTFWCGKWGMGPVLKRYTAADMQSCMLDCVNTPACKSLHFGISGARKNECVIVSAAEGVPTGVAPDFVGVFPVPPRA